MQFWNASGIEVQANASGVQLRTGSLESLIRGGIAFTQPTDTPAGQKVSNGHRFQLYPNHASTKEQNYANGFDFLLMFNESVRGLEPGAAVDYRGLQVGVVKRIAYELLSQPATNNTAEIPVLITLQPERFGNPPDYSRQQLEQEVQQGANAGLRATLKPGNLLTGSLYIDFDFKGTAKKPEALKKISGYTVLPTDKTGFSEIGDRMNILLGKLNKLPLQEVTSSADQSLKKLTLTLDRLEKLLNDKQTKALPEHINKTMTATQQFLNEYTSGEGHEKLEQTLEQLNSIIWQLKPLIRKLDQKPNAVIFGSPTQQDPEPTEGQ